MSQVKVITTNILPQEAKNIRGAMCYRIDTLHVMDFDLSTIDISLVGISGRQDATTGADVAQGRDERGKADRATMLGSKTE